ncbi:AAA+ family ATPase [Marispirochaeta aestuarii]|uniref:AAA+ family ATPase n=1 Tax=Marispirochaeta aestuarii TaxID=1963862 RepID=A0A1Y1S378_9SPIO|nr:DUF499 domain-containing protein [Marispirochaeta aestuarii]ORC37384.1 AAA+ family ATPase [Marispirochaeta aestuarii]
MALSNAERVGKALDTLNRELTPFVFRQVRTKLGKNYFQDIAAIFSSNQYGGSISEDPASWDIQVLLTIMQVRWNEVFSDVLGRSDRSLVFQIKDARNQWAHQQPFSTDEAYRALDSIGLLLESIASPASGAINTEKQDLLRIRFNEQARKEARKKVTVKVKTETASGLKPWREVIEPHKDVASGNYNQAEFAADLWEVYLGRGSGEYLDPREFFRRTFITEGLNELLKTGLKRISGNGGDPVVELQTNFGGGKTHSMLALYHLFSGIAASELAGADSLVKELGIEVPKKVNRAVIVGNKIPPGKPDKKADGTVVNTLWGEIAWQLGGRDAYAMIAESDATSTNPGDALKELFDAYSPCLILVDEWVAYARQFYDVDTLPSGTFDTQFTFAQTLSESAKNAKNTFLVVSVPASDNEIGGKGGQAALDRLKNAIGRVHTPWSPATAEEGFEIVRRRLFRRVLDHKALDAVARAFSDMYLDQSQDFPPECKEVDYRERIKRAYPVHPDLFDKLYNTWSTLDRFQRTRGVLRLMATVIYSLWEKDDRSLLIMPSTIPIDDPDVKSELTRYLEDNWKPVIDHDVDGDQSLPRKIDSENTNLGRYSAVRRVARTIYLGSAPIQHAAQRGIDEQEIKLGCVQPGEAVSTFGDALRRLADNATYLYVDNRRYWYSTQPTVRKIAQGRAGQIDSHDVWKEIQRRIELAASDTGGFQKVHVFPQGGADIFDEMSTRLVVLSTDNTHLKGDAASSAREKAEEILNSRGNAPRIYRNALVFLAADQSRNVDLNKAVRIYLAWQSILDDRVSLNLTPDQIRQAEEQRDSCAGTVQLQIPETFCWALVPYQEDPKKSIELTEYRLQGSEALAVRLSKKLRTEGILQAEMGGSNLKIDLDRIPLWKGSHVPVKDLIQYFFTYPYLPRVTSVKVLENAVIDGIALPEWERDGFAYADSYDDNAQRYQGLKAGRVVSINTERGIVVQAAAAVQQLKAAESEPKNNAPSAYPEPGTTPHGSGEAANNHDTTARPAEHITVDNPQRRFYAHKKIDPLHISREIGKISEEVLQHLTSIVGSEVKINLDIDVHVPDGLSDEKRRVIAENCNVLKFDDFGFEE